MAFTGKATYTGGAGLPELAEDVSDIIGIVSPHETPLLDHLGDPGRAAMSTVHEWIEDMLLPNSGRSIRRRSRPARRRRRRSWWTTSACSGSGIWCVPGGRAR